MKLYVLKDGVYHFNKNCTEYPNEISEDMLCSVDVPKGAKLCRQCESFSKQNDDGYFNYELYFMDKYRESMDERKPILDNVVLKTKYPTTFYAIKDHDLIAGRKAYPHVGFGASNAEGGAFYYCYEERFEEDLRNKSFSAEYEKQVRDMVEFWHPRIVTGLKDERYENAIYRQYPEEFKRFVYDGTGIIQKDGARVVDNVLDYDKLLSLGLPGLIEEVETYQQKAKGEGRDTSFYDGMKVSIQQVGECCLFFSRQAEEMKLSETDNNRIKELDEMATVLKNIATQEPSSFHEALQLALIYSFMSGTESLGRMDVYMGDFLVNDLNTGKIDEAKVVKILQSAWQVVADRQQNHTDRIYIGGVGRRNPENADVFAMLAMEANRTVLESGPQLTLRIYDGMDEKLYDKAFSVLAEGRPFPMFLNDDVNVDAVMTAFNIPREDAEDYFGIGCGEYTIPRKALGPPNSNMNVQKAVEAVLYNGINPLNGVPMGIETGELYEFDTFEKFFEAYSRQIKWAADMIASVQLPEFEISSKINDFYLISALFDGCIEKGVSLINGGAKYVGGVIESYGMVNAADSLAGIKYMVYDKKLMTLKELRGVLESNFENKEDLRKMMLEIPKFGNDDEYADSIARRVSDLVSKSVWDCAEDHRLHYFLVVNINNSSHMGAGSRAIASADGRRKGDPFANGMTSTAGMDKNGLTATLKSMASIDPKYHAGYVHNIKFDKKTFNEDLDKVKQLMRSYFTMGGTQAMLTILNKGDLEAAMEKPEDYYHIIVRVGGFCARFVQLDRDLQLNILQRTLN